MKKKKCLMVDDYILYKELDQIKEITNIEIIEREW